MDTTLTALRRDLNAKLTAVGNRLDQARDPAEMAAAITERKRLNASLAVAEAAIARCRFPLGR